MSIIIRNEMIQRWIGLLDCWPWEINLINSPSSSTYFLSRSWYLEKINLGVTAERGLSLTCCQRELGGGSNETTDNSHTKYKMLEARCS